MKRFRILLAAFFLLTVLGWSYYYYISSSHFDDPILDNTIFGPPADSLNWFNKSYYSVLLIFQKKTLTSPLHQVGSEIEFNISPGESSTSVSERLERLNIIEKSSALIHYLIYSGIDTQVQAGDYILSSRMTPIEIAKEIQKYAGTHIDYAILAGWRVEQIAENITISGFEFSKESFIDYVYDNDLEGFLLPGIYRVPRDISLELMVKEFVSAFHSSISEEMESGFSHQDLTTREAVTIASIVEREAVVNDEMPGIASVFINRLNEGMMLSADPTVQYSIGFLPEQDSWWKNPLTITDLNVDSPYNTYLYFGLPPSPICNPSIEALQAVAFPSQSSFFYFRAACDDSGLHQFSETYEEHLEKSCR